MCLAESKGWGLAAGELYNAKDGLLDIKLRPASTLRLTFVDDNGNFMRDVPVRLTSLHAPQGQQAFRPYASAILPEEDRWKARSGADGTVTFPDLPQGFYGTYDVEDKRFAKPLRNGFSERGNFQLDERALTSAAPDILVPSLSASIAGRLTFAPSGKPLAGAIVRVNLCRYLAGGESTTNEKGEYKISDLPAGRYEAYCVLNDEVAKEWTTPRLENIVVKEGQQLAMQDISLVHGAVVKGRVIAEEGGAPVSGFNLFVYKYRSSNTIGDTTAPDGTFQIRVPAGSHSLVLNLNGEGLYNRPKTAAIVGTQKVLDYVPRTADWNFDIADGQTLNLEFRLPTKEKTYPIRCSRSRPRWGTGGRRLCGDR